MHIEKKKIAELKKCYAILSLKYNNDNCFAVATEKNDPCYLFDSNGQKIDTLWESPGGVMSMVQVPGTNGQFISVHEFYSPDDSKASKLVLVTPKEGRWHIQTLVTLPHVHRIDILEYSGVKYFIACCVKSGSNYEGDWSQPGKIYMSMLPSNLTEYNEKDGNPLPLTVLMEGLTKNHGYYHIVEDGVPTSLISSDQGVFQLYPPGAISNDWSTKYFLDTPASDAVLADLDGDGIEELIVLSPFHGDTLSIYKRLNGQYEKVYQYPLRLEFIHALYGGPFGGKNRVIVGHREGKRDLVSFEYDEESQSFQAEILDHDCGPANIYHYIKDGKDILISANRETDEVAMYIASTR